MTPENDALEAKIQFCEQQQQAQWVEIQKQAETLKQVEVRQGRHQEAFQAIQGTISELKVLLKALTVRLDNLAIVRESEKNNTLEWAKVILLAISAAIFLFWLISTKGPTAV